VNYSLFILSIILIAWASIERYLFIYHERFITNHIILLHYAPILCFTCYTPSFYVGLVMFYPCEQAFDSYQYICGSPCYLLNIVPCLVDWMMNVVVVLLITCTFNIILIVCHFQQRHRMKRSIVTTGKSRQWVRIISLFFLSLGQVKVIGNLPFCLQIF
jgi:hypothetical protein